MVAVERDVEAEVEDGVIGGEVFRPEEGLLAQFVCRREETEHGDEDGHLEQHRQAARHRTHAGSLVQVHRGLLFLHRVLLLGIAVVQLLDFRFQNAHLGRRHIGFVCNRQQHNLDDDGENQDDNTVAKPVSFQPVENRDNGGTVNPVEQKEAPTERHHLFEVHVVGFQQFVLVRAEIEIHVERAVVQVGYFK